MTAVTKPKKAPRVDRRNVVYADIPAELREKLDRRCQERGTKVKFEVRRALELYLEKD